MTTKRVHLHRIRHRPEFLAEALKAPLGPSPFAPFCLLAAFESEWTLVLSCKCPRLVSNPPLRFYMVTSKGEMDRERDGLPVWGVTEAFWALIGHRVIAGISSSGARVGAGSPATSTLIPLVPSSNWLAGCYRHWDGRAGTEGDRRVALRGFLEHILFLRVLLLSPKGSNSCPG